MELTRNEQCELNTTTIVFDGGSSTPDIRQSISAGTAFVIYRLVKV